MQLKILLLIIYKIFSEILFSVICKTYLISMQIVK